MVEDGGEGGGVDRPLRHILLHGAQVVGVKEHGGAVLGGGDQHATVLARLHVRNRLPVVRTHLQLLASLDIPLNEVTVVVPGQQQVV